MLDIVLLIGGLVLTILAADWLVEGASSIAKRMNVSDLVIGLDYRGFGGLPHPNWPSIFFRP